MGCILWEAVYRNANRRVWRRLWEKAEHEKYSSDDCRMLAMIRPVRFRNWLGGPTKSGSVHSRPTLAMGKRKRPIPSTFVTGETTQPTTHIQQLSAFPLRWGLVSTEGGEGEGEGKTPQFSPPLAMQRSVWDSIVGGNFIDAKIFAFSRRSHETGRVDTPKALFVNTHVLASVCSYFRSRTPFLIF